MFSGSSRSLNSGLSVQSPATHVQKDSIPHESAQTAGQSFDQGLNRDDRSYEQASHTTGVVHLSESRCHLLC